MKIPLKYFAYFFIALFVGLVFAFGMASFMHQPLPLQVPLTTQTLPNGEKTTTDLYKPAPAPVIVTTEPLPTITPVDTPAPVKGMNTCNINGRWNSSQACVVQEFANIGQLVTLLATSLFISMILTILIRGFDQS